MQGLTRREVNLPLGSQGKLSGPGKPGPDKLTADHFPSWKEGPSEMRSVWLAKVPLAKRKRDLPFTGLCCITVAKLANIYGHPLMSAHFDNTFC